MASYLLVIGDREAIGWILAESRTAFPSAGRSEVGALAEGDHLFLCTTRGCFKNPTRDRGRVIGTASVTGPVERLAEPVRFGDREFPVGCSLRIGTLSAFGKGVELQPLVTQLGAFKRSAHAWSIPLRRPVLRISDSDARILDDHLADAPVASDAAEYTRWWRALSTPAP